MSKATDEFGYITKHTVSFQPTLVPLRLWLTERLCKGFQNIACLDIAVFETSSP